MTTELPGVRDHRARSVHDGFLRSATLYPDRPALEVQGQVITYGELRERGTALAAVLDAFTPAGGPALTAVFAHRSLTAFVGVLGALLRGHGYVPLNPKLPADRNRTMLEAAGCRAIVVDTQCARQLEAVLADLEHSMLIVLPDKEDVTAERNRWPGHTVVGANDLRPVESWQPPDVRADAIAYLLFTSGSTGVPKGVMVSHANVVAFVDLMVERIGATPEDRFSQMFDMTFDISVFDLFVGWDQGSCVCCPSSATLVKPGKYIRESELTIWFSVPSVALIMKRLGMLKPGLYPRLRWSLFAGEALPIDAARGWAMAAPNSVVDNMYGPTETTVVCTGYFWNSDSSPAECEQGIVPIGTPLPGMEAIVTDENLDEVAVGAEGELLMSGPLVTLGYLDDPEKTAAAYVVPPGREEIYYRTGDLVRRPPAGGEIKYLGRIDHQVKINGFRVELGEVEARLREATGVSEVVALGWPRSESSALAVTAFIGDVDADADAARAEVAKHLPEYMVPKRIHLLPELPLNSNGKFDRGALLRMLEEGV